MRKYIGAYAAAMGGCDAVAFTGGAFLWVAYQGEGLAGLLIAGEEDFLQLLEGGRTEVAECMMRIMKDDRHQRIRILLAGETGSRLFSEWSMRCMTTAQIPQEI